MLPMLNQVMEIKMAGTASFLHAFGMPSLFVAKLVCFSNNLLLKYANLIYANLGCGVSFFLHVRE